MLLLSVLRQNPEWVKERLAVRNIDYSAMIDSILQTDTLLREKKTISENFQSSLNNLSKELGLLLAKGETKLTEEEKVEVVALKQKVSNLKEQFVVYKNDLHLLEEQLKEMMLMLPNLPHISVPKGKTPADNVVIREGGIKPQLSKDAVPHWDIVKKYSLIDFELGTKITGSGFPVYLNKGAKLQRALIQYFLDYNIDAGYKEVLPPFMVNKESAKGTGQLPDKEGQMYFVKDDDLYLIPTAEVPVTNIYRDEILKENDLPIKVTAYTPCFRREAGNYGKDVRALNRVHQFDKVEIVQLAHPEKSYKVLEEMIDHVEKLLQSLSLPYRILKLCGGDMGFTSALTYDFEVYSAAQGEWLEVSSVSNFETFQTNRMKIRFKDENGKPKLLHSLNGSSLALPRIVACLLENNQTERGIKIPKVLQSYFGSSLINKSSIGNHYDKESKAIEELVHSFQKLRKLGIMRSQRPIKDLGEWFVTELFGGVRSNSSKKQWDVEINDKKVQVKTHSKSITNKIRWTRISHKEILNISELIIIIFTMDLRLQEFYQIPRDYVESLFNNNQVIRLSWDDVSDFKQEIMNLPNQELVELFL